MRARRVLVEVVVALLAASTLVVGAGGPAASAEAEPEAAERELAERFAPVMALVAQADDCGPGEPYRPSNVDLLFENSGVALRGPWAEDNLVGVGPAAEDLSGGLTGYSLDFPGNPLQPGCEYEQWADRVWGADAEPTIYARVATQTGYEGRLALQYFFFYPFNDYNNKHEGDWERIQLEFEAADAEEALTEEPVSAIYSQHYGAESAGWGEDKLEVEDDTHPVVYVSAGSHASQYGAGLYLGNNASTGFGCDTTVGPHDRFTPTVVTIPSDPEQAVEELPWIAYRGHWGEVGPRRFYEGPTGPNMKTAWKRPFTWSEGARESSYPVPGATVAGSSGTGFFCAAVGGGSDVFRSWVDDPLPVLLVLAAGLLVAGWLVRRTSWDGEPFPVRRRRSAGEVAAAAHRVVRLRRGVFVRLALFPAGLLMLSAVLQTLAASQPVPGLLRLVVALAGFTALVAFTAAVVQALLVLDEGGEPTAGGSYRAALPRLPHALVTVVLALLLLGLVGGTLVLLPLAFLLLLGIGLLVPVVQLEGRWGVGAVWRSLVLSRRTWRTTVLLLVLGLLASLLLGLLLAAGAFIVFTAPFVVVNAVPALVGAVVWPFVALLVAYAYFSAATTDDDPRWQRAEPRDDRRFLDPSIVTKLRIYLAVFLVALLVAVVDALRGTGWTWVFLAAGLLVGVLLGVVASRMQRFDWDAFAGTVVARYDVVGVLVLVGYVLFALNRSDIVDAWVPAVHAPATSLAVLAGLMLGQVLGVRRGLVQLGRRVRGGGSGE